MEKNSLFWFSICVSTLGLLFVIMAILDLGSIFFYLDPESFRTSTLHSTTASYNFVLGFGGAVMLGWGTTMIGISQDYSEKSGRTLLYATLAWFVTDTVNSYTSGFYLNIIVNILFLASVITIMRLMHKKSEIKEK